MKILNNAVANAPLAHVYELSDYMIISGAIYNKNPMYPLPLKYGIMEDPNSSVYLKETYDVTYSDTSIQRENKFSYILDNKNPKVHWGFFNNLGIRKFTETENGITCENVIEAEVESNPTYFEFLTQNDIYLFFQQNNISSNKVTRKLYVVDKVTFEIYDTRGIDGVTYLYDGYDEIKDEFYLYFNTSTAFYCYNVKEKTYATIVGYQNYSSYDWKVPNLYYQFIDKYLYDDEKILYTYLSYNNSSASEDKPVFVAFDKKTKYTFKYGGHYYRFGDIYVRNCCVFIPEKGYIVYGTTIERNLSQSSPNAYRPQLFCYEITGDLWSIPLAKLSLKNTVDLSNEYMKYCYTVCGKIGDDTTIFFANNEAISIYKWNTELKTYELYNTIYEDIEKVCIDANNNLWIYNANKDLYIPDFEYFKYDIILESHETDFEYNDKDIQTSVDVQCIDEKGNPVKTNVKLKIIGAAKFTETSNNIIEVSLNGEKITVPITIFGKGIIHIFYIN